MALSKNRQREFDRILKREVMGKPYCLDLRGKAFDGLGLSKRIFPSTIEGAEKEFLRIAQVREEQGRDVRSVALDSERLGEFVRAQRLLDEAGFDKRLDEFVREALPKFAELGGSLTFAELYDRWLGEQEKKHEMGDKTRVSLRDDKRLGVLVRLLENRLVCDLSKGELEETLRTYCTGKSRDTYNNLLTKLRMLMGFAVDENLLVNNPARKIRRRKEANREYLANIYAVEEVRRFLEFLLDYEDGKFLGPFVMVLFAGLRISAARVLTWDEIDLDREDPKVKPRHGKNQTSRRWRTIPPNAVAWLERCPTARFAPEYSEDRWNHLVSELLVKAGIEKKGANAMRHTFGTFAAKEFGLDTARQMMGQKRNSQQLEDHYLEYATKADAKAYFSILPSEE